MRFSLRRAAPEDAPAIADIHVRARRECMSYLPDIHSPEDVLQWIREVMPQHDEVWVAEDDGRVVGFFALSDNFLYHLYVYPELHAQGAGSMLFDRIRSSPRTASGSGSSSGTRRRVRSTSTAGCASSS
jgi:L-amino acid N-acyltransferase YncA